MPPNQRDRVLLPSWPHNATSRHRQGKDRWYRTAGVPVRRLTIFNEAANNNEDGMPIVRDTEDNESTSTSGSQRPDGAADRHSNDGIFWEALLRFPNAPLYATHRGRPPMYEFKEEDTWPNYHTMRVLGVGERPGNRIRHVYLLHNGLNETDDLTFHYRLAAWILNMRADAVCIIRPLPGHLNRYPFSGDFSETPLDEYLRDPMGLFRQFLAYMLETQWLLSIITPRSHDGVVAGGRLLPKAVGDDQTAAAHCVALAHNITKEWAAAFMDSKKNAEAAACKQFSHQEVKLEEMEDVVAQLHGVLGWEALETKPDGTSDGEDPAEYPNAHVVGYSMGGFMAQACFFGWPQIICSCTNLFAGGALRDLAPTAFAHPEQWQAVLHALRYELDAALADGLLEPKRRRPRARVAGVETRDFRYMKRIFYEVYLQYYRGGYSSRVAEFSRRLLFVVGGDDLIVRTENVLDAGPPEGMTLIQLADVSHFPGGAAWKASDQQQVEREQRMFWLPEIGRIIGRFSTHTERALAHERAMRRDNAAVAATIVKGQRKTASISERDSLDGRMIENALDDLLDIVGSDLSGWLLVGRNEIPAVFLGPDEVTAHARALHHSEELIAKYVQDMRAREARLRALRPRMTLLIPLQSAEWFVDEELRHKLLSYSETPGAAYVPSAAELQNTLKYFDRHWCSTGAVSLVKAGEYKAKKLKEIGPAEAKELSVKRLSLTMLPDVWIALSPVLCERLRGPKANDDREGNEQAVVEWASGLASKDPRYLSLLDDSFRDGEIVALKVSASEFNPRYSGHILQGPAIGRALRHWALAYRAAKPAQSLL
jgi:hypothetical protein